MGEFGEYAKIVRDVKTKFAKRDRPHAGEEVSHEIAKRWARHKGRKVEDEPPKTPADVSVSTEAPTAAGPPEGPVAERKPGDAVKMTLPDFEDEDA